MWRHTFFRTLGPLHGYAIAARLEQVSSGALQLNMGELYPEQTEGALSRIFTTWNQLGEWLRQVEALRRASSSVFQKQLDARLLRTPHVFANGFLGG